MSVPVQLTKQTIFDSRRTPITEDSEFHSSLMSPSTGPLFRSESGEKCARFLVNKDMNLEPKLVTKIKVFNESNDNENEAKDPFLNHQFAFKLVKKDFTGKKKPSLRTNCIRGLKTLENVAIARKLRSTIEEQQENKVQVNQTQKESECSFLQGTDQKRPASRVQLRITTPEFKLNFTEKQSQTAKIIKDVNAESFYTPKDRESAILSVKRTFESELKEIPEKLEQTSQGLNAAQSKITKLMLRISSASSCKNLASNEFFNSELLKFKSSAKNKDTCIHIKRSATPSIRLRTRVIVNSRPDTSLDRFSTNRLDYTQKAKQMDTGSKNSLSCGRETTDHTPNGTKTDNISSRIFVQENPEKKAYMSASIQELPSLNTSMHFKADIAPPKTCVSGSRSRIITREVSRQFETLAESLVMKNDRKSAEGIRKAVILEQEEKKGINEENEAKEKEFRERLLREETSAGPKILIQQKSILRVSSAKQESFKSKIVEECDQANTELNQLAKKMHEISGQKEVSQSQSKKNINFASGNSNILNEIEIGFIREEYEKKVEDIELVDYDKIENLVSRLKYFSRLPKDIRMGLLRNGSYEYYASGSTIFKQGDIGDVMYVILRGSVNIRTTKKTSFGVLENSIVATLYDGIHFGEYTITSANLHEDQKDNITQTLSRPLTRLKTFGFSEQAANIEDINKEEQPIISDYVKEESFSEIKTPEASAFSQREYQGKPRRMATAEAAESCDILCIPRDKFQDVFLNLMQKELDDKVKILSELSFFNKLDPVELMPLANNLISKAYKMGEVIQAAGEPVEKFRLIVSGRCELAIGVTKKRDAVKSKGLTSRVASAKNLNRALNDQSFKETQAKLDSIHFLGSKNEDNPPTRRVYENRAFNFEQLGRKGEQILYIEHVSFGTLSRGKFIGGRALLTEKDFKDEFDQLNAQERLNGLAKISLVADTPKVEILEISQDRLKYIPESLLKIFKQGLVAAKEFDDYNIEDEVKVNKKWSEFKELQVAEIVKMRASAYRSGFKVY